MFYYAMKSIIEFSRVLRMGLLRSNSDGDMHTPLHTLDIRNGSKKNPKGKVI